jgi:hypothetical protein
LARLVNSSTLVHILSLPPILVVTLWRLNPV